MERNLNKTVFRFQSFINDVLGQDIADLKKKIDKKSFEIAEFLQLKSLIDTFKAIIDKKNCKSKVDLGGNFFVQAKVEDTSHIFLDIGFGHFVEFTLDEAVAVINIRIKLFEMQIESLRNQVSRTNAHIKLILIGIRGIEGVDSR